MVYHGASLMLFYFIRRYFFLSKEKPECYCSFTLICFLWMLQTWAGVYYMVANGICMVIFPCDLSGLFSPAVLVCNKTRTVHTDVWLSLDSHFFLFHHCRWWLVFLWHTTSKRNNSTISFVHLPWHFFKCLPTPTWSPPCSYDYRCTTSCLFCYSSFVVCVCACMCMARRFLNQNI